MKKTQLAIMCMMIAGSVQARMGFGNMDVVRNYGRPQSGSDADGRRLIYRIDAFELTCFMVQGRVNAMMYRKPGEYENNKIFETEIDQILELNAEGLSWEKMECPRKYWDQHFMNSFWRRSDGVLAFYNRSDCYLFVIPPELEYLIFSDGKQTTGGL